MITIQNPLTFTSAYPPKRLGKEKLEERMERWMELSELAEEIEKNRQEMA